MTKQYRIQINLTPEEYKLLRQHAAAEKRSMKQQAAFAVTQAAIEWDLETKSPVVEPSPDLPDVSARAISLSFEEAKEIAAKFGCRATLGSSGAGSGWCWFGFKPGPWRRLKANEGALKVRCPDEDDTAAEDDEGREEP